MAAFASFSESDWQTTRVSPGARRSSAEASERAFGTAPLVAVRDGMSRVLRPADAHADRGARTGEVAPPQLALRPAHADRDDVAVAPVADGERVRAAAAPAGDRDQCQLPTGERVQR